MIDSKTTANQLVRPLTVNDIVEYLGVADNEGITGNNLTLEAVKAMLNRDQLTENIRLMSSLDNSGTSLFSVDADGNIQMDTDGNNILLVAYIDLNFLPLDSDGKDNWTQGTRLTQHKYNLIFDPTTGTDTTTIHPTQDASDNASVFIANNSAVQTITTLTAPRSTITFYAYTSEAKDIVINDEQYVIDDRDESNTTVIEIVNQDVRVSFVTNPESTNDTEKYRHFTIYFSQTDDEIATNCPELLVE